MLLAIPRFLHDVLQKNKQNKHKNKCKVAIPNS